MSDLISRRAAIEIVRKAKDKSEAHRMLVQLPPAQPSVSKTEIVGDVISRQAVLALPRSITRNMRGEVVEETIDVAAIKELPSAQPGCEDCIKHGGNICPPCPKVPECEDAVSRADVDILIEEAQTAWLRGDILLMYPTLKKGLQKVPSVTPSAQPGWIPCSERLPYAEYGESDTVLTTCGYRDVEDTSVRWIRLLYFNGGNWCYPTGETYEAKVYAWMPLPKPWEGGRYETD